MDWSITEDLSSRVTFKQPRTTYSHVVRSVSSRKGICLDLKFRYKYHSIGRSLRLDKYNGRELGQKLSKCILDQLELSYLTSQSYSVEELP
jgi:hypothetical protein